MQTSQRPVSPRDAARPRLREAMWRWRNPLVALALVATVLLTPPKAELYGDNLQIALPLAGLGCAVAGGGGGEYFLRFLGLWLTTHATKRLGGDAAFNIRPHGGGAGFPSAHTTAAVFGASSLVHNCVTNAPLLRIAIVLAAGFTGASRMEARAHDIWQVLGGAVLALGFERALRRPGPARRAARRLLAQGTGLGFNALRSATRRIVG